MDKVDYLKLADQYAAFLVAVGSVSITVLALVLNLRPTPKKKEPPTELQKDSRTFLIAALIVATVSCFIGAHMMAETAAFFAQKNPAESGTRLFFLASTNIFVAALLVLFSLMLLPAASGKKNAARLTPISITVCLSTTAGILWWLILAARYRMHVEYPRCSIGIPVIIAIRWFVVLLYRLPKPYLLSASFAPIVILTVFLLCYFAGIFAGGGASLTSDIFIFSLTIFISFTSLLAAGIGIRR